MFSKLVLKHRNPRSITNSPQNKTCVPSVKIANSKWEVKKTYTKIPVTIEAMKVPNIANVTIAPKFEKKGFCKGITLLTPSQKASPYKQSKRPEKRKHSGGTHRCETEPRLSTKGVKKNTR